MTTNFEIVNFFSINYNGREIDLHNNFYFTGYEFNVIDRRLILKWIKSAGDWVGRDELSVITLMHFNVFYFNTSYDNKEYKFPADDRCLGEISFFTSSSRDVNDAFMDQSKPKIDDDIIYSFQGDYFIRVGCDKIELIAK